MGLRAPEDCTVQKGTPILTLFGKIENPGKLYQINIQDTFIKDGFMKRG
jgi:hypothetical protein